MAFMMTAKNEDEVKKTSVSQIRKDYNKLAETYNKIIDGNIQRCPICGEWKAASNFYHHKDYANGFYPICKSCILLEVENRKSSREEPNETKESVMEVLRKMNLPYIDSLYESCKKNCEDNVGEKIKSSPFQQMLTALVTLPQYKGKTWDQSDFGESEDYSSVMIEDTKKNQKIISTGRKRFGLNYSKEDVFWLENEYQDWCSRYPVESKAQEVLFKNLACQQLERENIRKNHGNTKDIDKQIQDTMTSLGIKPAQSDANSMLESNSFGEMIRAWEMEKPIPEIEPEFRDVSKIGTLLDVFFKGHLAKMMGLSNGYSKNYDQFMKKYTVERPDIDEEEEEALFNTIFGKMDEDGD